MGLHWDKIGLYSGYVLVMSLNSLKGGSIDFTERYYRDYSEGY